MDSPKSVDLIIFLLILIIYIIMYNYHNRDSNNNEPNNISRNRISEVNPNNGRQTVITNNSKAKQEDAYKSYQ